MTSLRYRDTVAHRLAGALARHGVRHVFGQSLPSMVHLAGRELGLTQVAYRQENSGGYMADGYARISRRVGVVTAQNGPAAALLTAPLAEALKASVPLLALIQDIHREQTDRNAFQELDHEALFRPCAKWVRRVTQASRAEDYLDMAFVAATSGRPGPAVLLLPADLLIEPAPAATTRRESSGEAPLDRVVPDPARLDEAAELLARAESPLVIAGGGVHTSGACEALSRLQEQGHLPVATTVMGKGAVDERHPLSVGVVGYFMGTRGATRHLRSLLASADVILLVGNRTNQNGTDSWSAYPGGARYLHLDVDPAEIGRNYEALRLVGDARLGLEALADRLAGRDLAKRRRSRAAVERAIAEGRQRHVVEAETAVGSSATPIRPERVMGEIDRRLTPETIVVADASYSSIWVANYLRARRAGMRFLTPRGLAGLGWGLPMALGARVAEPKAPIVCVAGDGGLAHAWAELETSVRMRLPVALVVLNNGVLAYQMHAELTHFGAYTDACELGPVDHAAIARACGANGIRVERPSELGPALDRALSSPTLTLVDVVADPKAFPPVTSFEGHL
jgi:acetolactate synthase-1/2/3 large subunit